jgi:hypothetical protein
LHFIALEFSQSNEIIVNSRLHFNHTNIRIHTTSPKQSIQNGGKGINLPIYHLDWTKPKINEFNERFSPIGAGVAQSVQ